MKMILMLLIVLLPVVASASNVVLEWDANTETDLSHYVLYYGTESAVYTDFEDSMGLDTGVTVYVNDDGQTYYFALRAFNLSGVSSDLSNEVFKLTEAPTVNQQPTSDAGGDQNVDENCTVTLDGFGSFDPDGDSLDYTWAQILGPTVGLNDPTSMQATFITASSVGEAFIFELTVTDPDGLFDSDSCTINVIGPDGVIDIREELGCFLEIAK